MLPYEPTPAVLDAVEDVVRGARLSKSVGRDVSRELIAYAEDHGRELHFDGKTDEEIEMIIMEKIGDTKKLGGQMYVAHRRLYFVPWIGPLFYDEIVRGGILVAFLHVSTSLVFFILTRLIYEVLSRIREHIFGLDLDIISDYRFQNSIEITLTVLPIVIAGFFVGQLVVRRYTNRRDQIDVVLISIFPFLLSVVYILLAYYFGEYGYSRYGQDLLLTIKTSSPFAMLLYIFPFILGLLFPPSLTQKILQHIPFIRNYISL